MSNREMRGDPERQKKAEIGHYFKALAGNERSREVLRIKAQSEGVNTGGGILVPETLAPTIIGLLETYGVFRANAQRVVMPSDTHRAVKQSSGVTATWTAEGAAIAESTASLDLVGLTARKLACLVRASSEIVDDAAVAVAELVTRAAAFAMAKKEDEAGFLGDGSSTYSGQVGVIPWLQGAGTGGLKAAASGHNSFAAIDGTDIAALMGLLPAYALPGAKWYVHATGIANTFFRLAGTSGGIMQNDAGQLSYFGYPIQPCQVMKSAPGAADVAILFGDLSYASILGDRREYRFDMSTDRYFDADQLGFRVTERVHLVTHALNDTATAGGVVALQLTA